MRFLALILAVLGAWIAFIGWRQHRLNSAVAAMPAAMRASEFRRAYQELSTTCATQPQLVDHCSAEAEFILRFPQCTADCARFARHFLPTGRR